MKFANFLFAAAILFSVQSSKAEEVAPPADAMASPVQEKSIFETRSFEDVEKMLQANGAYVVELSSNTGPAASPPEIRHPSAQVH